MLAVQFTIDTKNFDSFRKPFVTNKYMTVIQWEETMRLLNRAIWKQLKLSETEQIETNGEFMIDGDLHVTYRAKPKDECFIDFSKLDFPYELSWMLSVTISRSEQIQANEQTFMSPKKSKKESSQKSSSPAITATLPSELEYDPSPETKEIASRYTPSVKSEKPNRRVLGTPEYCPQNTDKSQPTSSYKASKIDRGDVDVESAIKKTRISRKSNKELFGSSDDESSGFKSKNKRPFSGTGEEEDPIVVASQDPDEEVVVRPKKRGLLEVVPEETGKRTRSHKKGPLDGWLKKDTAAKPDPENSSRSSKAKSKKNSEAGATSKKQKTTKENKDPIDFYDEEEMQRLQAFVESSKMLQEKKAARRLELIDYEMKHCTDMSNDELKR